MSASLPHTNTVCGAGEAGRVDHHLRVHRVERLHDTRSRQGLLHVLAERRAGGSGSRLARSTSTLSPMASAPAARSASSVALPLVQLNTSSPNAAQGEGAGAGARPGRRHPGQRLVARRAPQSHLHVVAERHQLRGDRRADAEDTDLHLYYFGACACRLTARRPGVYRDFLIVDPAVTVRPAKRAEDVLGDGSRTRTDRRPRRRRWRTCLRRAIRPCRRCRILRRASASRRAAPRPTAGRRRRRCPRAA